MKPEFMNSMKKQSVANDFEMFSMSAVKQSVDSEFNVSTKGSTIFDPRSVERNAIFDPRSVERTDGDGGCMEPQKVSSTFKAEDMMDPAEAKFLRMKKALEEMSQSSSPMTAKDLLLQAAQSSPQGNIADSVLEESMEIQALRARKQNLAKTNSDAPVRVENKYLNRVKKPLAESRSLPSQFGKPQVPDIYLIESDRNTPVIMRTGTASQRNAYKSPDLPTYNESSPQSVVYFENDEKYENINSSTKSCFRNGESHTTITNSFSVKKNAENSIIVAPGNADVSLLDSTYDRRKTMLAQSSILDPIRIDSCAPGIVTWAGLDTTNPLRETIRMSVQVLKEDFNDVPAVESSLVFVDECVLAAGETIVWVAGICGRKEGIVKAVLKQTLTTASGKVIIY